MFWKANLFPKSNCTYSLIEYRSNFIRSVLSTLHHHWWCIDKCSPWILGSPPLLDSMKIKSKEVFLIVILEEHTTYIFTLFKVNPFRKRTTLKIFVVDFCSLILFSCHQKSFWITSEDSNLVQDNSGVIENAELSGFLKDLLELVRI